MTINLRDLQRKQPKRTVNDALFRVFTQHMMLRMSVATDTSADTDIADMFLDLLMLADALGIDAESVINQRTVAHGVLLTK